MLIKSRLLRYLLTGLVLLLFTGYFAFSTFLFSPLEDDYEYDVANLAPRDVDFFIAKARLVEDFPEFPRPAFADDLEAGSRGQAFLGLPAVDEFLDGLGLEETLAELDASLAQAPVDVEPLELIGGRDLAIAGYLRGPGFETADWAVYGRVGWLGKLGVALLDHPDAIDLEAQGFTVAEEGVLRRLEGGELTRPLYITRILDVVILGTDSELVTKAHQFESSRGQDSFGQSAKYGDFVSMRDRNGDELELYLDYRAYAEQNGLTEPIPDPRSEDLGVALLGRFFQLGAVRELVGMVDFTGGVQANLHGMLSSENMTSVQKRFARTRAFDRAQVVGAEGVASMVPADVGLFAYLHVNIGDLLAEAREAAEPDLISNLEDLVRSVWGYPDLDPLLEDFEASLRNRVAICMRRNDYPEDPPAEDGSVGSPPHNGLPVYAWAVVLSLENEEALALSSGEVTGRIEDIRKKVIDHQNAFAIQGPSPGSSGVFTNKVDGGYEVYEFWSELIDGTGHISTVHMGDYFIVSNHHKMLGDMVASYLSLPGAKRLADDPWFSSQVNTGLASSNVLVWLNPRAVSDLRRQLADQEAELAVQIDWSVERPRLERLILKEHFPGENWGSLSPEVEQQVAIFYQQKADEFEAEFRSQHTPAMRARMEREILASELLRGALFQLSVGQKDADLLLRLLTPFDEEAQ